MPSAALSSLQVALAEISELFEGEVTGTFSERLAYARARGRAQAVLLSSHFERYIYAVNEEAVSFVNNQRLPLARIPLAMRLLHTKPAVESLNEAAWDRRGTQLIDLMVNDGWLWTERLTGELEHTRLLAWMTAPKPASLVRYYKYWQIQDVFSSITRRQNTRGRMWLNVQELVDKRNFIAHGDFTSQATSIDVRRYLQTVSAFCTRADRVLAGALAKLSSASAPW